MPNFGAQYIDGRSGHDPNYACKSWLCYIFASQISDYLPSSSPLTAVIYNVAEIFPIYGVKHYPINQSINQSSPWLIQFDYHVDKSDNHPFLMATKESYSVGKIVLVCKIPRIVNRMMLFKQELVAGLAIETLFSQCNLIGYPASESDTWLANMVMLINFLLLLHEIQVFTVSSD